MPIRTSALALFGERRLPEPLFRLSLNSLCPPLPQTAVLQLQTAML
jgi:hypothetical protein